MKRYRFTQDQIIGILKEHPAGASVADLCRQVRDQRCDVLHITALPPVSVSSNKAADKDHAIVNYPVLSPTYAELSVPIASYTHPARGAETPKAAR